uniref:Ribosomal protein S1 n=1 Tax=Centroceras clavulatum TaxID=159503 RepID=A0A4D6WU72_9FLOR|nr:ribosomal protein S1 [Centroceras clavulatum]
MCNNKKLNSINFSLMLKKYSYNLHPGDIVAGTILYDEKEGLLVNIGDTIAGYLPNEEISLNFKNNLNKQKLLGTTREFFILANNINKKQSILSIKRLEYLRAWKRLKQIYKENIIFNLYIENLNKGGIVTYLESIQSFIPNSHLSFNIDQTLKEKKIRCKILIIDEKNNQVILSNKSAMLQLSKHKFRINEIVYGKIVKIKQYGLFIEINSILALLHISEISSTYIKNLYKSFSLGQIIKIKIIHIDLKQGRLSLSKKLFINHHQQS